MTFTLTTEQEAIVTAAQTTQDNLLICALAGAAKTSTLVEIAKALPQVQMLCLAFNKKIAVEMEERLPDNCKAMTLNSLGHRVWAETIGKRLVLQTDKVYTIVSGLIGDAVKMEQEHLYETMADILKMVNDAKTVGYVPDGHFPNAKGLMDDEDLRAWYDEEPTDSQWDIIKAACVESIKQGISGTIDFNDQILLPTIFPAVFPVYPLVLTDESQDFSALNHKMIRKLVKKRIIAVGDECQAIYGFRGAHQDSMNLLQETFSMRKLLLSISFRCPVSVVKHAQWRAPHMQWPEWAKPGEVRKLAQWDATHIPDNAAIICRNNAPIFRIALRLLKARRFPQIVGNDLGKALIKIMKKFGKSDLPQTLVYQEIDKWKAAKLAKSRSPGTIHDQAECMYIFAEAGENLGDAIAYAEHIFNSQGPIQLMTGHKSKGLEFDDVFILDRKLIRDETEQQDANLLYVMQTRAKGTLTYIETEGFMEE